ncbi:sugar ABC transporter permease [Brachybacterium ginsengisoli]|uniref:Sugar ABC transporter permease n=1 Tax=Brachybacterium ginsengisoli TaxID=1331682 RepID=A0A291H0K7_9MICO|nr:carbohydrate ABC transporter permease [Brachybacterium ginsengisoli]ATG55886.1 sugar ABC transporter permease [Brachybacterium ginsengisoli]
MNTVTTLPLPRRRTSRHRLGSTLRTVAIAVVLAVLLLPIVWMVLASLRTTLDIVDPQRFLTAGFTLDNYRGVLSRYNFSPFIANSFLIAFASTLIALVVGAPAAFAISRFHVRNATAFLMLARVLPGVSLLVPWFFLFSTLGVVGGYPVLIGTHVFVTLPFVVAVMAGFFTSLPEELEESAQVDGLTRAGAFLRITLPLSVPGLATSAILAFIFSWNNFLFALVLSSQQTRTLPVAISNFTAYASVDWGGLMAAAVVITLPVILVALVAQKYVVSGLAAGATKG